MMGRKSLPIPADEVVEGTIRMSLQHIRRPQSKRRGDTGAD
jgi:hypothetical protein